MLTPQDEAKLLAVENKIQHLLAKKDCMDPHDVVFDIDNMVQVLYAVRDSARIQCVINAL